MVTEPHTFKEIVTFLGELEQFFIDPEAAPVLQGLQAAQALIKSDRCLMGLKPGEPWFTLRGQDKLGPPTIKFWVSIGENDGVRLDAERIAEIASIMTAMEAWPNRKLPD